MRSRQTLEARIDPNRLEIPELGGENDHSPVRFKPRKAAYRLVSRLPYRVPLNYAWVVGKKKANFLPNIGVWVEDNASYTFAPPAPDRAQLIAECSRRYSSPRA